LGRTDKKKNYRLYRKLDEYKSNGDLRANVEFNCPVCFSSDVNFDVTLIENENEISLVIICNQCKSVTKKTFYAPDRLRGRNNNKWRGW